MARPPGAFLVFAISLAVAGVLSDDGLPKWSQRSASNSGWVPIDTPCESCRAAALADQETQATSGFASAAPASPILFGDASELRPPPAPLRVQRQEAAPHRPLLDPFVADQRPPPPPVPKPTAGKQGRESRFPFAQNLPRQQFNYLPENHQQQQDRVVFPTHQVQAQAPQQNLQSGRQQVTFLGQQLRPDITAQRQQQSLLRHQQSQQHQQLQQNPQGQHPHQQIKLQSVPHDQFPLILPPAGLGPPHGFQSPQLHLLPVPHSPQPSASQVDLQSVLQQQLQRHLHHQINQQLLGTPFVAPLTQFPPSALGQQLQFPVRNPTLTPANLHLVPQQQQQQPSLVHSPQTVNQQLELTPSNKPKPLSITAAQVDSSGVTQENVKNSFQSNPEEDVEEEVQLLYVPVEALRQRDRVNKEAVQSQHPGEKQKQFPERQNSHSSEIKHYQDKRPTKQNVEQIRENVGTTQAGFEHGQSRFPIEEVITGEKGQFETQNIRSADQVQATVLREEKQRTSFSPPPPQQFHENIQFQGQRHVTYQNEQIPKQLQDDGYRVQTFENLQQEEQQRAVSQQPLLNSRPPQRESHQFYRKPSRSQEENGKRMFQEPERHLGQSYPIHTTSRPASTSPSPTFTSTQSYAPTTQAPYQPPLSVYMEDIVGQGPNRLSVDDVLRSLNGAATVPVLERPGPNPPKVFVGPSVLRPPQGYAKFELPYLSMIDSNRVERKVDRLPFFVAPLSFQPPQGYAKIPFPAPHVGSVVVSSTPIQSTTERVSPVRQTTIASILPQLVNSLQTSVSPVDAELILGLGEETGQIPVSSSQQPPPRQVHKQHSIRQQFNQQQLHHQQSSPQEVPQQHFHEQQIAQHEFSSQVLPQQFPQQQVLLQQPPQHQLLQQHAPQQQVPGQIVHEQQVPQQNIPEQQVPEQHAPQHQQQAQQFQPQQQPPQQQPTYVLYTTPSPSQAPIYYSSSTSTTTSSTTTLPPQTRAPTHQRGRSRHRQSYSQTSSPETDYNYRNRGSFRGNSQSESTRQPSVRQRRPWDGRRRTTTTTEQPTSSETLAYNSGSQNFNPVSPQNQVVTSTIRTTEPTRDTYSNQEIKEVTPPTIEQQYSKDDPYAQSAVLDANTQDGQFRTQGAFVLTAFQHPQVLGDVINGKIQRPENPSSFRNYYGTQHENTESTFETGPHNDQSIQQIQSPLSINEQHDASQPGSPEVEFSRNKELNHQFQNRGAGRVQTINGERNDVPATGSQSRGQQHGLQHREQESPIISTQKFYQDEVLSVTLGTLGETKFPNSDLQGINHNNGAIFRSYNQQPNSIQNHAQNVPVQQIFPTEFTPSIQISEIPLNQQSTPLPKISNSHVSQQPQLFVISTPIPNPTQGVNSTYINRQNIDTSQPVYQPQIYHSQQLSSEQREPIAEIVNEGLATNANHQAGSIGQTYKIADSSVQQFVEESPPQLPHRFQVTATEYSVEDVHTEGEPKRTRFRQQQKTFSESTEAIDEERPRYRQQQLRNNADIRIRQPSQRTRSRYHTTESPLDEDSPSSATQRAQSPSFLHQRFRGRQRTVGVANTQETTQYLDNQAKVQIPQNENSQKEAPHTTSLPVTESLLVPGPQIQQFAEPFKVEGDVSEAYQNQYSEEQVRKPEREQPSQTQYPQEPPHDTERPTSIRSRGRFRNGGERVSNRQRGQVTSFSNQDSPANGNSQSRNPIQGLRYQQIPRQNPAQEIFHQEAQRPLHEHQQKVTLPFDDSKHKTSIYQKTEDEGINPSSPIVINSSGTSADLVNLNPVQGPSDESQAIIPENTHTYEEQYEQSVSSLEDPVTPSVTTEATTTTASVNPGRKYSNFVSRGLPRRPSHVTAPVNVIPSTTSAPDTIQSHKVYTVRPARRPVIKSAVNTRARIRRPTTPATTTTTTTTTPEPPYFLTTASPTNFQGEFPSYDQSSSFGSTRGNFRTRKRPVAVSRRPKPSSNEVQQEEQEDEPSRLQGSYRQRSRGSSRRVSTLPPERPVGQWRQPVEENPVAAQISTSAQGFETTGNDYVTSQGKVDPSHFQIALSDEHLAIQTATRTSHPQGNVKNIIQRPAFQQDDHYFSQESQQQQEIQEPRLKYQSSPIRPSAIVGQDDSDYLYEQSRPSLLQPNQQKQAADLQKGNAPVADVQPRSKYEDHQQGFVLNFSGLSTAEAPSYNPRDELDSGEETRYFDKFSPLPIKPHSKLSKEHDRFTVTKSLPPQKFPETIESHEVNETLDVNPSVDELAQGKSTTTNQQESTNVEPKDVSVESEEKLDGQSIKKVTGRRRGNWVRVRTKGQRRRPGDMLETAESQNLATVSQNLLQYTTPMKGKTESVWEEATSTEETGEEKVEETAPVGEENDEEAAPVGEENDEETAPVGEENDEEIAPIDKIHNAETIDDETSDVFGKEESITLNEEENDEIKDQPVEDIIEDLQSDDDTSIEKEIYEIEDDLNDSSLSDEQHSSHVSTIDSEEAVNDNKTSFLEIDKTRTVEEENDILEDFEGKTSQSESRTESIENNVNNSGETVDVTTEESLDITTEIPTPRVLGTSTTTEISLETEICYRGRCVKTKVDADQVPIE